MPLLDRTGWTADPWTRDETADAAIVPTLVLLGFAVLFGVLTLTRFRWEES